MIITMFERLFGEFTDILFNGMLSQVFSILWLTLPIWAPFILGLTFWELWIRYVRKKFILEQKYVLLEIGLPAEIKKTPLAMEVFFNGLHFKPGETTWINRIIQGRVRPWWSLELVSIGGTVHFFIWTRESLRNIVEAQLYAQYPEIEITEAEDYSRLVNFEVGSTGMWGCDFELNKEDSYPIKTYIDYGLDSTMTKEEQKVDPLASIIEFLGSIKEHEQVWFQILIQHTKDSRRGGGSVFSKRIGWKDEANDLVQKLREKTLSEPVGDHPGYPNPTKGQAETMAAIERSVSKHGFDCGIRGIYFTEGDFNPSNITGITSSFKQFSSNTLNGFHPARWLTIFDYPWQDFRDIRANKRRVRLMDAYRKRSWFHPPYKTKPFVLNTEELATIFHLPGEVIQSPAVARISSRRSSAPPNLPR